jgi:SAM-dependent methyltransferase
MDTRELGLLLAQQLLKVDDLHYGWWEPGQAPSIGGLPAAQQRYNEVLLERLVQVPAGGRVLDVGCGVGRLMELLWERGVHAEGVNPSVAMCRVVRARLGCRGWPQAQVHECRFEDFPAAQAGPVYDAVVFSESFQYIPMARTFEQVRHLLAPRGVLLVCDFFRTAAHGDGGPGDGTFGGGHAIDAFERALGVPWLEVMEHRDVTRYLSPNLALVQDLLMDRVLPASRSIGTYLRARHPWASMLARWLWRGKLTRLQAKYLSGHRSPEVFERYKTYRLVMCRRPPG